MNSPAAIARKVALHCEAKNEVEIIDENTAAILIGGSHVLVDVSDLPLVAPYRWSISRSKSGPQYAHAYAGGGRGAAKYIRMHRLILGLTDGRDGDHINGDGLDNRRANLRPLTRAENLINTGAFKGSRSGVRGVCWYPPYQKWRAYIHVNKRMKTLGYVSEQADAIAARRAAEEAHFPDANKRTP